MGGGSSIPHLAVEGECLHVERAAPELVLELRHEQPPVAQQAPQGGGHGVEHQPV